MEAESFADVAGGLHHKLIQRNPGGIGDPVQLHKGRDHASRIDQRGWAKRNDDSVSSCIEFSVIRAQHGFGKRIQKGALWDAIVRICIHGRLEINFIRWAAPPEQHGMRRRSIEALIKRGDARRQEFHRMFSINPGNDRRVGEEIAGPKSFCRVFWRL